jgi:hypothetical protein
MANADTDMDSNKPEITQNVKQKSFEKNEKAKKYKKAKKSKKAKNSKKSKRSKVTHEQREQRIIDRYNKAIKRIDAREKTPEGLKTILKRHALERKDVALECLNKRANLIKKHKSERKAFLDKYKAEKPEKDNNSK